MNCFKIGERVEQVEIKDFRNCPFQYVLVLNPAVFIVSIAIVIGSIILFRKKKWL